MAISVHEATIVQIGVIPVAEYALDETRTDLRRPEDRTEADSRRKIDAPRLQKDQQVHNHNRADAAGD
jgi:hypothetical protein